MEYCRTHDALLELSNNEDRLKESPSLCKTNAGQCHYIGGLRCQLRTKRNDSNSDRVALIPALDEYNVMPDDDLMQSITQPVFKKLMLLGMLDRPVIQTELANEKAKPKSIWSTSFPSNRRYPWILVQIQGSLHDCDLSSVISIDEHDGSWHLDWKQLFTRFWQAKRRLDKKFGLVSWISSSKQLSVLIAMTDPRL